MPDTPMTNMAADANNPSATDDSSHAEITTQTGDLGHTANDDPTLATPPTTDTLTQAHMTAFHRWLDAIYGDERDAVALLDHSKLTTAHQSQLRECCLEAFIAQLIAYLHASAPDIISDDDDTRGHDIMMRYYGLLTGERETLKNIGLDYDLSASRIRQLREKHLQIVRDWLPAFEAHAEHIANGLLAAHAQSLHAQSDSLSPLALPLLQPPLGEPVSLNDYDPNFTFPVPVAVMRQELSDLRDRVYQGQVKLYTQREYALLIVLQAVDAGGKDSAVGHLYTAFDPTKVKLAMFKFPTPQEQAYDFLWRIHQQVPPKGFVGIFNRSHYEDVVGAYVNNMIYDHERLQRFEHINHFEQLLVDNGVAILKFYLHISKDEQYRRLTHRTRNMGWKLTDADWLSHEYWDDYQAAYEMAISHCNTAIAPWHIIPANNKLHRNYIMLKTIVDTLEGLPLDVSIGDYMREDLDDVDLIDESLDNALDEEYADEAQSITIISATSDGNGAIGQPADDTESAVVIDPQQTPDQM